MAITWENCEISIIKSKHRVLKPEITAACNSSCTKKYLGKWCACKFSPRNSSNKINQILCMSLPSNTNTFSKKSSNKFLDQSISKFLLIFNILILKGG